MPELHAPTLLVLTALMAAVSVVFLVVLLPDGASGSRAAWLAGLVLLGLQGAMLVDAEGVLGLPAAGLAILGGVGSLLGMLCFVAGLWHLARQQPPWLGLGVTALAGLAAGVAGLGLDGGGVGPLYFASGVVLLPGLVVLARPIKDVSGRLRALLVAVFLLGMLSMGLRSLGAAGGVAELNAPLNTCSLLLIQLSLAVGTVGYVLILRDRGRLRLRRRAELDPLTGVFNRAALQKRLAATAPAGAGERVIVMLFDVLDLGGINQRDGPTVGDRVLQGLARRLRRRLPTSALIGRYAADQFLVVQRGGAKTVARDLAVALCEVLARDLGYPGIRLVAGVSEGRIGEHELPQLMARAETDLGRLKSQTLRRAPDVPAEIGA